MTDSAQTLNEFVNVKDIHKNFLYTRDGYLMTYLRIHPLNISLMSMEEKKGRTAGLAASFEGDRGDFVYFSFPREIDLDKYKQYIRKRYQEELEDIGRRHLLGEMLLEASELATSGENYEHQHFIKLWKKTGQDRQKAETGLMRRTEDFKGRYESAGIPAEILQEQEIIRMCNLFGNALQAPYGNTESGLLYENIVKLGQERK